MIICVEQKKRNSGVVVAITRCCVFQHRRTSSSAYDGTTSSPTWWTRSSISRMRRALPMSPLPVKARPRKHTKLFSLPAPRISKSYSRYVSFFSSISASWMFRVWVQLGGSLMLAFFCAEERPKYVRRSRSNGQVFDEVELYFFLLLTFV